MIADPSRVLTSDEVFGELRTRPAAPDGRCGKERRVVYAPEARHDANWIYETIAQASSHARALGYIDRIDGSRAERGSLRSDIRPGLRIVGFERRISVALVVTEDAVTILRVLYRGATGEGPSGSASSVAQKTPGRAALRL